jgi:hypothetical protein
MDAPPPRSQPARRRLALGLGLLAATACSSSKSDAPAAAAPTTDAGVQTPAPTPDAGPPGAVSTAPGTCAKNDITIAFSPMFTAFDGIHSFQVPAVVSGVAGSAITWSSSNPALVGLQPDPSTGGVMITALGAGTVDIIASAGSVCGVSKLTITQAVNDDWTAGDMRYNNGVVLERPSRMGRDGGAPPDGPPPSRPDGGMGMMNGGIGVVADGGATNRVACTNCHGPTANGPYKTVSHTPQQIGGFNDEQLAGIFNGIWPTGSGIPFDATIVPQRMWETFHKWDMTADEAAGVIIYLRALTPAPQTGSRNFGGRGPGGADGGPPPPPPAAAP